MNDYENFSATAAIGTVIFSLVSLMVLVMGYISLTYARVGAILGLSNFFTLMFNYSKHFLIAGIIFGALGAISLIACITISIVNFIANR